jgi:hypothetical protein
MSKIVKKKDLDVLIESTMSKAGIKKPLIKEEKMGKLYTKVLEKNFAGNWSTPQNDFKKAAVKNFFDKVKKGEANFSDYFDNGGTLTVSEEDFVNEFKPSEVTESKSSKKSLINEDIQKELNNFNKLINYTFKK